MIASCSTHQVFKSAPQSYRAIGETQKLNIDARLVKQNNLINSDYGVVFTIDNEPYLFFQLSKNGTGSLSCSDKDIQDEKGLYKCTPHNNNPIGANCIGSTRNGSLVSAQCTFTYNNEIAANFNF